MHFKYMVYHMISKRRQIMVLSILKLNTIMDWRERVDIQQLRYSSRFSSTRLAISLVQTRFLIALMREYQLCSPTNDIHNIEISI